MQTRRQTLEKRRKKRIYRTRVKNSQCRGLGNRRCSLRSSCKFTNGAVRKSYCRKNKNEHI